MPDYLCTVVIPSTMDAEGATKERIVRAKNEAAALKFIVADSIAIDRASIDDAMRLAKAGCEVEVVPEA